MFRRQPAGGTALRNPTPAACLAACLIIFVACESIDGGHVPVGGDEASDAALERFVRRVHLDL
jgi:hypothetical protein